MPGHAGGGEGSSDVMCFTERGPGKHVQMNTNYLQTRDTRHETKSPLSFLNCRFYELPFPLFS